MLKGYNSVKSLPFDVDEQIDLFIRLRVLYVYLSRLHMWSEYKTTEQKIALEKMKELVHKKSGWTGAK